MKRLITRTAVGPAAGGVIDAATEALVVECEDLEHIEAYAIQSTDAGTATLQLHRSPDGVTFVQMGADFAETALEAGNGGALARSLSDSNGMDLAAKQIRLKATALAAGGVYTLKVCGFQRDGFR